MNTRLQQFLGAENISQSQFADEIGVARASVSHILAGRNKPGYDFITNLMARYPRLNMEWLLAGKGKMYKDGAQPPADIQPDLFTSAREQEIQQPEEVIAANSQATESVTPPPPVPQMPDNQRKITKIIVFYDDNSYQELQ